jgi:1-acyl-sn-glycerol-3-phosphate acyltransferase
MNDVAKVIQLPTETDTAPRWVRPPSAGEATVASLDARRADREAEPSAKPVLDEVRDELAKGIGAAAAFLRRRITGDYRVDDFGFDADLSESLLLPLLRPLSEKWFRVEVSGLDHIPDDGAALIVANHAGVIALDGMMLQVAVHDKHPAARVVRPLAADMVFDSPLGSLFRKGGATLACRADAERLLRAGELAAVFPEGFKGVGKPFENRYRLQRFGRGGFVSSAVAARAPIIPCSIVGSEEIYPMLADLKPLARLLGLPYFPVTPLFPHLGPLGVVPLPSKWHIEFGEPIDTAEYEPDAADDPMVMFEVTDQVRETIQQTLYKNLARRRNVFLG